MSGWVSHSSAWCVFFGCLRRGETSSRTLLCLPGFSRIDPSLCFYLCKTRARACLVLTMGFMPSIARHTYIQGSTGLLVVLVGSPFRVVQESMARPVLPRPGHRPSRVPTLPALQCLPPWLAWPARGHRIGSAPSLFLWHFSGSLEPGFDDDPSGCPLSTDWMSVHIGRGEDGWLGWMNGWMNE